MFSRVLIIFFILHNSLYAQKHEVSFDFRYGIATSQLKPNDPFLTKDPKDEGKELYAEQFPFTQMKSIGDWGVDFLYKFRVWKKGKLYLTSGVGFGQSRHYLPLTPSNQRILENVRINQERMVFRLGLNKKFYFFNNKVSLDIGVHLTKRFFFKKVKSYSEGYKTKYMSNIEYKYNVETFYDETKAATFGYDNKRLIKGFFWDYNATLGFHLKKNTVLRLGVSYTRNYNFYYNYSFRANYYSPETGQWTSTQGFQGLFGLFDPKYVSVNHYISLHVGVAYTFDSFKRKNGLE